MTQGAALHTSGRETKVEPVEHEPLSAPIVPPPLEAEIFGLKDPTAVDRAIYTVCQRAGYVVTDYQNDPNIESPAGRDWLIPEERTFTPDSNISFALKDLSVSEGVHTYFHYFHNPESHRSAEEGRLECEVRVHLSGMTDVDTSLSSLKTFKRIRDAAAKRELVLEEAVPQSQGAFAVRIGNCNSEFKLSDLVELVEFLRQAM